MIKFIEIFLITSNEKVIYRTINTQEKNKYYDAIFAHGMVSLGYGIIFQQELMWLLDPNDFRRTPGKYLIPVDAFCLNA